MANTAHLFRRQSSRDLVGSHRDYTRTLDELELKVIYIQSFYIKIYFIYYKNTKLKGEFHESMIISISLSLLDKNHNFATKKRRETKQKTCQFIL